MESNSSEFIYLSFATRTSILSIILSVVLTPTSEDIKISSSSSNTSSFTLLFPIINFEILLKNDVLVFFKPLFRDSFFCSEKSFEKTGLLVFEINSFLLIESSFTTVSYTHLRAHET